MPTKARPMTAEEAEALEAMGQAHEEGRALPAPEMVLFTGETALKVRELSDLCGIQPQEVIGVALQNLYELVKERERQEREGKAEEAQGATRKPQAAKSGDPFRPY